MNGDFVAQHARFQCPNPIFCRSPPIRILFRQNASSGACYAINPPAPSEDQRVTSSNWPTRCDMPDLSALEPGVSLRLMLNRAFCKGGPSDAGSFALVVNFVRIVDVVLADYHSVRAALTTYVTTPNEFIYPLFEAISHTETCVTNLLRAIKMARRIRQDKAGPQIDRHIAVLTNNVADRVLAFRNKIQHVDDTLINGTWQPPAAHCLITRDDRIELYGKEILYAELARWITTLHGIASELATYKET